MRCYVLAILMISNMVSVVNNKCLPVYENFYSLLTEIWHSEKRNFTNLTTKTCRVVYVNNVKVQCEKM